MYVNAFHQPVTKYVKSDRQEKIEKDLTKQGRCGKL